MTNELNIPWQRYAIIAELAKRLDQKSPQFGKTALQKMIYLLQEIFKIDCGYTFELYSYGPFTSQVLHDLDFVEHLGGVEISVVNSGKGGFHIKPGEKIEFLLDKGKDFLSNHLVGDAFLKLVNQFGSYSASELELRSTIIYIDREIRDQESNPPDYERIFMLVKEVKPKFSDEEIQKAIDELRSKNYIILKI